ncbi:MAG TPA: tetratricopeptide repeat protein [Bryobacteraceae bacterium]|nr:tetratricopeptide repeat protein [Bryobacteraceae bacterium]
MLLLLGVIAAGQLAGQTGGMGGTTPTTGNGGQTSVQANPTLGSGGGARGPDLSRPIYISGRVAIEDGSALPENITIQRVCSGISKTVAYTDPKGHFNFQWGDRNIVMADAADAGSGPGPGRGSGGGFGSAQSAGGGSALATDPFGSRMMNCELRAYVAGFNSDTINLFNRRAADNPDVGVIVLHRLAGVSGSSISMTSMKAPKEAKKAYEHGLQSLLKNKQADAVKDFEKAVAVYPSYADAWVNLGKLRLDQQSIEPAREALHKAMESDPQLVAPYLELGLLAARDAKWEEAGKYLDRALELDPVDFPQAWYADAVANYNLKKYDAAERSARAAVKLDTRHANPRSDYLLGMVLVEKQDYAGAAAELTAFVKLAPDAPDVAQVRNELGRLEKLMSAK